MCRAEGAEALGELLAKNTFLTSFQIWCLPVGPFGDEAFGYVCKGLMANETLTCFVISLLPWTKAQVGSFVEVIRSNTALRELTLERNEGLKDGAVDVLEAVIDAGRIGKLKFSKCQIGANCLRRMCEALKRNKTLRCLSVERDTLGLGALGELLSKDAALEELALVQCNLETEGEAPILSGLTQNKTLRRLNLSDTHLGPEGGRIVAEMLKENDVLEELVVRRSYLGTEGMDVVVDGLLHNTTLKTLDVYACDIQSCSAAGKQLFFDQTELV